MVMKPHKTNILRYRRKYRKLQKKGLFEALKLLTKQFIGYLREFNYFDRYTKKGAIMYDLKQTIERVGADRIVNKDIKVELGVVYVEANGTQFKYEQDNWHQFCEICWVQP